MIFRDGCFAIWGTRLSRHARTSAFVILLTLFPLLNALAQPSLDLLRVVSNWPTIELYYRVDCGGTPAWNLSSGDFRVSDAGREVMQFTMSCADPTTPEPFSVALVFDASGSMAGAGNTGVKDAGRQFVSRMNVAGDEAAVLWFNQSVTLQQSITSDTTLIKAAIDALPAAGATAVWDGIWAGLHEVALKAANSIRAVVVVTDGGDNSSTSTVAEIIAFANQQHIRVFAIGLGTGINATELTMITELTGGQYYQSSTVGQLAGFYIEIASRIHQQFLDCSITYTATCADGALHVVDLSLPNFCNGSDTASLTYRAPRDTTTFSPLALELSDVTVQGGEDFVVPFRLPAQLNGEILAPLSFDLCFEKHYFELRSVQIPQGGLLDGIPLTMGPTACGMRIQTGDSKAITGSGDLLLLNFRSILVPPDTVIADIIAQNASFSEGCFTPVINPATITILPGKPVLNCDMQMPRSFSWDVASGGYIPSPFQATLRIFNTGNLSSTGGFVEIAIDTTVFRLMSPTANRVAIPDILPGTFVDATWQLALLQTVKKDSSDVWMRSTYTNHGDQDCMVRAGIRRLGPRLSLTCRVPTELQYDSAALSYQPNPFTVEASCANNGTDTAFGVTATLLLPAGLVLDPPSQSLTQSVLSMPILPWRIGDPIHSVSWTVRWTELLTTDTTIVFPFTAAGQDGSGDPIPFVSTSCALRIPGVEKRVNCDVSFPDSLVLNAGGTGVEPNPVSMKYSVRNNGLRTVTLTRVYISFPPDGFSLSPASPIGINNPISVSLQPGDSIAFEWGVDVQNRNYSRYVFIQFTVLDSDGDPHPCGKWMFVPGLLPDGLSCSLVADSIAADVSLQQYHPMPFAVTLSAYSNLPALSDSIRARIILPGGGLTLSAVDAGLETKPIVPGQLFPQQAGSVGWMLEHPLTTVEKRYIVRTLLWENGGDTTFCETEVVIPAMQAAFWFTLSPPGPIALCDGDSVTLHAGGPYASYLWSTQDTTESITVTQTGSYWCGVLATDGTPGLSDKVTVTVHPLPAKPIISRTGDVLSTDPAAAWQWHRNGIEIAGAIAQSLILPETGSYTVSITDTNGCEALSDPYVVNVLALDEGHTAGQRFHLYPNPVDGVLNVDVVLERPAAAVITIRDLLGRELRRIASADARLSFTERIDLRELQPGMYFVQLQAGVVMRTQRVVVKH
ncbi:MAG: VWA domain-containing protein [Bacteroidota bacterium]